jgi:hypothetical protein
METVTQRHNHDCFLCCLAMALELPYEEIVRRLPADRAARMQQTGADSADMREVPELLGFKLGYSACWLLIAGRTVEQRDAKVRAYKATLWGRRAIVQVESINYPGDAHLVFWDGHELHDPTTKKAYVWEDVVPQHVWLVDERPARA